MLSQTLRSLGVLIVQRVPGATARRRRNRDGWRHLHRQTPRRISGDRGHPIRVHGGVVRAREALFAGAAPTIPLEMRRRRAPERAQN